MSLICPKCHAKIGFNNVRAEFHCPLCSTKLTGHILGVSIIAIVIWSICEMILSFFIYRAVGHEYGLWIKAMISAVIGLPIYYLVVKRYGSIRLFNEEKGGHIES
jgi:hypothetical protein